ncbi:hypothetical protein H1R20_g14617, partial [Candolleomyces eurysporus]
MVPSVVRTKLDADLKLLPCTSLTISVRCYEHRIGRVNVTNSKLLVDYTQVLWSKPDDVDYEPIGVLEYPFRITLPSNVAGFSTAVFVDYRCTWRVEAGARIPYHTVAQILTSSQYLRMSPSPALASAKSAISSCR